jgi:hypothetical protein
VAPPAVPVKPGDSIEVSAAFDNLQAGTALFSLETSRRVILGEIQSVPPDGDPERDAVIAANHAAANDKVITTAEVEFTAGAASALLDVPDDLPAALYYLKVYAHDADADAMGHASFMIAP